MTLKPASLQWSEDGVLKNADFDDIYFQRKQGVAESDYVFLEKNRLRERFSGAKDVFRIAELGFGTGLNFLLTAQLWRETAPPDARLFYVSAEKHPLLPEDLKKIHDFWPELRTFAAPLQEQYPPLIEGFHHLHFQDDRIHLILLFGDVKDTLPDLTGSFDAWYLDGFSPEKNPEMWDEKLFPLIAAHTKPGGTLSTFSAARSVLDNLEKSGFKTEKIKGYGVKRVMTVAQMPDALAQPEKEKRGVTILGAGISGASAAYALAQKGYKVTIIDRQPAPAQETSGNPVSIACQKMTLDISPAGTFNQHGFFYTRALVTALKLPSWNPCGVIHIDMSEEDSDRHKKLAQRGEADGHLRYEGGLYQPLAGFLSPAELCRALLSHPNITAKYSTSISSLEDAGSDIVVIALGHGSKDFKETEWLPLHSLRGQLTFLKPTKQSEKISRVICHEGYITPPVGDLQYIGATFQKEEPDVPMLRREDHLENMGNLEKNIPGLGFSESDIEGGRAGYRSTTPDRLPAVGACPDQPSFTEASRTRRPGRREYEPGKYIDGIYLSTGFGSHGVSATTLSGEIVACLISGDPLPVPESLMEYLLPERFILRDLKRGKV